MPWRANANLPSIGDLVAPLHWEPMAQELETRAATEVVTFADRLVEAVQHKRSQLVVGLDPRPELLPVELRGDARTSRGQQADACARFCNGIIDAIAPYAVAVKPNIAFFEALGFEGVRAFEETCAYARQAGLLVIVDAKRGDLGSTARAYATAYLEPRPPEGPLADALTVNTYLGRDSLEPFLLACKRHGGGLFCLVKTSNAGSIDVQDMALSDGRPLWQLVAHMVNELAQETLGECGLSSVGAVVGATHPRAVAEARKLMPQSVFLLPGVGAQGATPADVARAFTSGPASALVSASRSVIYAYRNDADMDWRVGAGAEAKRLRDEVWAVSGW
ncbi:MAG: orotidine-5-phosphate decarboxylase [Gaiellaceae bacterium]|nr:orotidine-5-phosphate decarboxylase [Gaiellaceae bacterium]